MNIHDMLASGEAEVVQFVESKFKYTFEAAVPLNVYRARAIAPTVGNNAIQNNGINEDHVYKIEGQNTINEVLQEIEVKTKMK